MASKRRAYPEQYYPGQPQPGQPMFQQAAPGQTAAYPPPAGEALQAGAYGHAAPSPYGTVQQPAQDQQQQFSQGGRAHPAPAYMQQQASPQYAQQAAGLGAYGAAAPAAQAREPTLPYPEGQAHNAFMRSSLNCIPSTAALFERMKLPLGITVHPLAEAGGPVPVVDFGSMGVLRCKRCRVYINPFVTFQAAGREWVCNICSCSNEVAPDYFCALDASGRRTDHATRPELRHGCVEYVAPPEYMVRPPQPAVFFFVLDVSYYAVNSHLFHGAVAAIREMIDTLPGSTRTQFGLMTFDSTVHFYRLRARSPKPVMMVVSDLDDVFLPAPADELLVNLAECKEAIVELLDRLPEMFKVTQNIESAMVPALKAAYTIMRSVGGKMIVLQSTLPSAGPVRLNNRANALKAVPPMDLDKDSTLLRPADAFFKNFALDCSRTQISIDTFLDGENYVDVATLGTLAQYTGGQVFFYPVATPHLPPTQMKIYHDMKRNLSREVGFEAVMRVRASKGLRLSAQFGNFFIRSTDLLALPTVDADKAFALKYTVGEDLPTPFASFQAALLYTTSNGERRIRVCNICLPTTQALPHIYKYCDVDAMVSMVAKMAIEKSITNKIEDSRVALSNLLVEIASTFRASGEAVMVQAPTGVSLPESLNVLPLYILAMRKMVCLRPSKDITVDERVFYGMHIRTTSIALTCNFVYPRLFCLSSLPDESGVRDPTTGVVSMPPQLQLSAERLNKQGAFMLDDGQNLYLWVAKACPLPAQQSIAHALSVPPAPESDPLAVRLQAVISAIRAARPLYQIMYLIKEGDPMEIRFYSMLVEDRTGMMTSYSEFMRELATTLRGGK